MKGMVMIQGTTSGVGKSTITMGICRYFANKGIRVAPFKPQNMSTNWYTFENGDRMAMSQVMQAAACKIAPEPRMNPILLAPLSTGGCEAVVMGEHHGNFPVGSYMKEKPVLKPRAIKAFETLMEDFDVVIVEGSGGPAELNLVQDDIANMGFATAVGCPVVLVADISRGGVFGSLYGTIELLEKEARELVKGLVVNKLKGKVEYFGEGNRILEEITSVPVLGVLPYMTLDLEDEDTLTETGVMKTKESITKGLAGQIDYERYREEQLDILAEEVAKYIDLEKLEQIIVEGGQ